MGKLTTHVLDTARGTPAAGMSVRLFRVNPDGPAPDLVVAMKTNGDGRCDVPLLEGDALQVGTYILKFGTGDYFRATGVELDDPAFLDVVPIRFGIANPKTHYHVPLLVSPYGYSTYRGS